jgi:hypothetical protein
MSEPLSCRRCGEPIGVYEPLIALLDGRPRETSRAAEPIPAHVGGECYHRACFEQAQEEPSKG